MGMTNTAASFPGFLVRFTTVDRQWNVVTREKSFKTADARAKWLDKNEDKVNEVLAFSDPQ
jgi:hypothetical protein